MDLQEHNGQVLITFENKGEIDFLYDMCVCCIDYGMDDKNAENAQIILDFLQLEC